MKSKLVIAAQFATLGATAVVLIATSPPPRNCTPSGPTRYAVNSSCGPSGFMSVANEQDCQLQLTGAEQVNLPNGGAATNDTTFRDGFSLSMFVRHLDDGGVDPDAGLPAPSADGGVPQRFVHCSASPSPDAGTVSVMELQCFDTKNLPVCNGSLVQDGPLADGGTP